MRNKYTHQQLQQEEYEQQQHHQRNKFLPMLCSSSTKQVIKLSVSHRRCSSTSTSSLSPSSSTVSDDPLSPRVGCMGQVKRNNKVVGFPKTITTNTTTTTTTTTSSCTNTPMKSSHDQISNYYKLKRFFTPKTITTSPTTTFATAAVSRSGTHKFGKCAGRNGINNNHKNRGIRACSSNVPRDDHGAILLRSKIDDNNNCGRAIIVSTNRKKMNNYENDKGSFVNLMDMDPPLPVVKHKQQQQVQNNGEENLSLWKRRSRGASLKSLQVQATQQSCNLIIQPTTV